MNTIKLNIEEIIELAKSQSSNSNQFGMYAGIKEKLFNPLYDNVILICGRPGMGKTFVSHLIMNQLLQHNTYIPIICTELINHNKNNECVNSDKSLINLIASLFHIKDSVHKIYLHPESIANHGIDKYLSQLLESAQSLSNSTSKDNFVLVIDTIQFLHNSIKKESDDMELTIDEIVKQLKCFADSRNNIKIIITSELPREIEYRNNHRPTLNDLNAYLKATDIFDRIIALYRDSYYAVNGNRCTELIYINNKQMTNEGGETNVL